ncbi:hypothetical protein GOBAR_DD06166 [Gossypium barbadense]|nr:hypothetical protein GOBAR_DD06166 [Gossypium barbadense]
MRDIEEPYNKGMIIAYDISKAVHVSKQQQKYWKYAKIRDESNQLAFQSLFKSFDYIPEFSDSIIKPWNPTCRIGPEDSATPRQDASIEGEIDTDSDRSINK